MKFGSFRINNYTLVCLLFVGCLLFYRRTPSKPRHLQAEWRYPMYRPQHKFARVNFLPDLKVFVNEAAYVDHWQRANPRSSAHKLLVFSAYYDGRTAAKCVRVIGATLTKRAPTVYCKLHFEGAGYEDVTSVNKAVNEHQGLKYAAFFFNCCFKTKQVPRKVSVSADRDFIVAVDLPVHNNRKMYDNYTGEFAVCVKPFHYEYNRATWLLEFLEFNRLMGVEHFFFYNHTVGKEVQPVLQSYVTSGLATILPWELDLISQKEIRTEGIFAALNDCVFRTMYRYRFVVMVDLDEYVVPRTVSNYSALIREVHSTPSVSERQKGTNFVPSCYIFKNVFFYLYWENDTTSFGEVPEEESSHFPYLLTQYKTRRVQRATQKGRTKYIVHPEGVLEVGNHVVWKELTDFGSVRVDESDAIMHHYRICEFGGFDCLKHPSVVDRSAQRFSSVLLTRVMDQCRNIFPTLDGICPISPPLGSPW